MMWIVAGRIKRLASLPIGPARRYRRLRNLRHDVRGSGIVEFMLIAPAMLLIYCALGELAHALETSRKTGNYTRTIADLVGRAQVDSTGLTSLFDAASVILQPYRVDDAKIVVSAMGVYKVGNNYFSVVCSSAARNTAPRARFSVVSPASFTQTTITTPATFQYDGARFVLAEVQMPFTPVLGSVFFKWINQSGAIYFKDAMPWPERTTTEIVLPGGQPCTKLS